jgi:hypothetical protein
MNDQTYLLYECFNFHKLIIIYINHTSFDKTLVIKDPRVLLKGWCLKYAYNYVV